MPAASLRNSRIPPLVSPDLSRLIAPSPSRSCADDVTLVGRNSQNGRMSGSVDSRGIRARVGASFQASVGDIVFGMEDGAVSIFGLVFGVAAGGSDSHAVVLAGATGAVAAAVSVMAGAFLDTQSVRDKAPAEIEVSGSNPSGTRRRCGPGSPRACVASAAPTRSRRWS